MAQTILLIFVITCVGTAIMVYTLGPLVIWITQKIPTIVKFTPVPGSDFLLNRNAKFYHYHDSLLESGFTYLNSSEFSVGAGKSFFSLYVHYGLQIAAMVATVKSLHMEISYIEISQRYKDGTSLSVYNSNQPSVYPLMDFKLEFRYPKIFDVGELIDIHQRLRDKYKKGIPVIAYDKSDAFSDAESSIFEESEELCKRGICHQEIDSNGMRKLTLKGAYMMSYRCIFPGTMICSYLGEKRSLKALEDACFFRTKF